MKKLSLKIIGGLIVIILMLNVTISIAATKSELSNSSNETDQKIKETEAELNNIKTEKSAALQQVETLTGQISDYENQIKTLDNEIADLNSKISEAQEQLNKAQEDYTKQEQLLEARLVATYEAGETSYLDFILSSDSITDLISNYYLVTEVATSDAELLEQIQKQKEDIEKAKTNLESSKNELATSKASKQSVSTQLKTAKEQKSQKVTQLSEEEKQTQAELEQFEADKRAIQNELEKIAREERNNNNNNNNSSTGVSTNITPSASGFIFPVAGLSKGNISNKNYPSYAGHTGVDVNINVTGKTIVAAKGGEVISSIAYKNSEGKYYSYGECIVINHGGGLATLYAHGLPGSRRVSKGEMVSQGQAIMTVGTTGNSSGNHLHFEVLVNGVPVNPMNYLP